MPKNNPIRRKYPLILPGAPEGDDCDHCGEPAEHRVRLRNFPRSNKRPRYADWDLCGTCLLREQHPDRSDKLDEMQMTLRVSDDD